MNTDFKMKHAKMLLTYQTYLLYNIKVKLESADAYKAINYFLEKIRRANQKISNKFFQHVEAHVDADWLGYYNEFTKLYIDMGFRMRKLDTTLNDNLTEYDTTKSK